MKVRGKIGVYGRSLGGIASCHLAKTFPNIVQALIVDRTFSEMDQLAERRLLGRCTSGLFKLISFNWRTMNDRNFIEAKCFKVLTCDPNDDVVDNFSSLHVGVAKKYAVNTYTEARWFNFFECLCLLYELEDKLNEKYNLCEFDNLLVIEKKDLAAVADEQSNTINENHDSSEPDIEKVSAKSLLINSLNVKQADFSVSYIRSHTGMLKEFKELYELLNQCMVAINDFQAGSVALKDIINSSKSISFTDFQVICF